MVWIISGLGAITTTIGFFGGKVKLVTETTKFLSGTFHFSVQMFLKFKILVDLETFLLGEANKFTICKLVIWNGFGCKGIFNFVSDFFS
jgi:hypothetical protein